jgi:hypothetical protein
MNALPEDLPDFPDPPEPRAADWQRVREAVRRKAALRRIRFRRAVLTCGAIAACFCFIVFCWPKKLDQQSAQAERRVQPEDWIAGYDVLPIATSTHYMVSALNGPNDDTLLTVDHPLKARMSLATVGETTLTNHTDDDANRVFLDTTEVK